jgi:predicted Rossmann fold flavoprotein
MKSLGIELKCSSEVIKINFNEEKIEGLSTKEKTYFTKNIIIATGGLGYPSLGATGDGYEFAKVAGHSIRELSPAMMPLHVKENWVKNCRADTIAKVQIKVDMKKHNKLNAIGDLIFTKTAIRGPVVLDFARDITPLLKKYGEVPILLNFTKGMNEEKIRLHVKNCALKNPELSILDIISTLIPISLSKELCNLSEIAFTCKYSKLNGINRDKLLKLLAWTPLHVIGHDGFKMALITRGGVSLKEINPKTMESKFIKGLYFCGEVLDLDGPCGGYNLQWSFSSGYLAGALIG